MTFINQWLEQIRKADASSTYKMAWAKAITHVAFEYDESYIHTYENKDSFIPISLFSIAEKFLGYYWDQDVFFRLYQNSNPNKKAEIINIIRKIEPQIFQILGSPRVHLFSHIRHQIQTNDPAFYTQTINKIVKRVLKQDVSHRFLNGVDPALAPMYHFTKDDDTLYMPTAHVRALRENMPLILDVINLRWVMLLEQYNNTPRIAMKVKHMDLEGFKRTSLKKYKELIALENPSYICFECKQPITNPTDLAIDHVIPWSYLYSDDLWNLVFIHKSCNSKKSNTIPSKAQIEALKERNARLLHHINQHTTKNDKNIFELKDAIEHNLVEKFWIQCNG